MFCIQNGVDNTLCFAFLLSCAYPESRTLFFLSHALPVGTYTKETGREQSWDRWPELTKGTFHTPEHHAQYRNWAELPGRAADLVVGIGSSIHNWVVSNFSPFLLLLLFTIIVAFYFIFNY